MRRLYMVYAVMLAAMSWQVDAQNNQVTSNDQIDQTQSQPSARIQIGDSLDHVLKLLGDPRVDCPLKGGKRVLIYEAGEIHLQDGKVTSFTMLTDEQLAEKREREHQKKERSAANKLNTEQHGAQYHEDETQTNVTRLRGIAADLKNEIRYSKSCAIRYKSNAIEAFSLMAHKGGKSGRRYQNDLLDVMANDTLEEFYNFDFNFEYFEREYRNNPGALLTLNTLRQEYALFVEEYERLLELEKALSTALNELKKLETMNARAKRQAD